MKETSAPFIKIRRLKEPSKHAKFIMPLIGPQKSSIWGGESFVFYVLSPCDADSASQGAAGRRRPRLWGTAAPLPSVCVTRVLSSQAASRNVSWRAAWQGLTVLLAGSSGWKGACTRIIGVRTPVVKQACVPLTRRGLKNTLHAVCAQGLHSLHSVFVLGLS